MSTIIIIPVLLLIEMGIFACNNNICLMYVYKLSLSMSSL